MKPGLAKLSDLMRLVDDDTPLVRHSIAEQLAAYGDELEAGLEALAEKPDPEKRQHIHRLLEEYRRDRLVEAWHGWLQLEDGKRKLETALSLLADFLSGKETSSRLGLLLDELADQYRSLHTEPHPEKLADFLFKGKQLGGAQEDYYNPCHSNLIYVIEEKRGLPISLACIYMLVGTRLGIKIEGCNFPGHFLAQTFIQDEVVLVDCFNGGRTIPQGIFKQLRNYEVVKKIINRSADTETIVTRVLTNLARAFREKGFPEKKQLMEELLTALEFRRPADTRD